MIKNLCFVSLVLILLFSACTTATPDGPNMGNLIPGVGIKEVQLFDTKSDVEKKLGKPKSYTTNPFNKSNTIAQYPEKGLEISYLDDAVGSIVLYSSGRKDGIDWLAYEGSTNEGIWPQSNLKTIKSKLGQPLKELPQAVIYPGLWIRLDKDGQVESFSISIEKVN
ncbi:hypothetical protein IJT10_01885 [bacterium]|nr:hypothetical protein [bacterium]